MARAHTSRSTWTWMFWVPVGIGVLVAYAVHGTPLMAFSYIFVYIIGWQACEIHLRASGMALVQMMGFCPVDECSYECSGPNPPAISDMLVAHMAEVHEIHPGMTT